jgi:S1-C subfamily serine protease
VVLPGGQFVVTAVSAIAGATRMQVVTSKGERLEGKVVATDKESGVAVVSTGGKLKPASFANEDVVPGELAVTACLCSTTARPSIGAADIAVGSVQEVGRQVSSSSDGASLMDAIEAETPLQADWGEVLLDGHGNVIGILDGQESADSGTMGLFIPSSLALSVADELAHNHRVEHGWIGVNAQDAPGGKGAMVNSVLPSSPAAGAGIEPGDVVTAIDAHDVSSHADLQARLYTMPPGSTVNLTLERSGTTRTVSVALGTSPGG